MTLQLMTSYHDVRHCDVGYDVTKPATFTLASETASQSSRPTSSSGSDDTDPLFNMLLHLQEAASNESFGND